MNLIVKEVGIPAQQVPVNAGQYELFITEEIKDVDGNIVVIPRSIGQYSLAQLEMQKESLTKNLVEINEKIAAINAMINQ